jgi:hypothetical protein
VPQKRTVDYNGHMNQAGLKSLSDLFTQSAQAVKRNLSLFVLLNVVTFLGVAWDIGSQLRDKTNSSWSQVFVHSISSSSDKPTINIWLICALAIVGIISYLLLVVLTVKAATKKIVKFSEIWETFKVKWWKIVLVEILVVILIFAGLILFIIPGLIILSRLVFAPFITINRNVGVVEALNESWSMTKGYAWTIFTTILFSLVLSLPSIIPIVGELISTVLVIAYSVALPIRYFEIKNATK